MSKRGLSRQEKKDIIVKLLRDTKEPYAMPDLENKAATLGVVKQTVKEIVLEIASEGLCETDKIGPTAFYWAFPSAAFNKTIVELDALKESVATLNAKHDQLQQEHAQLSVGREPSEARNDKIARLEALRQERMQIEEELKQFADNDPAVIDALEDIKTAIDSANRWTDNIFSFKTWATQKFNVPSSDFDKNFEIPESMDYVDF